MLTISKALSAGQALHYHKLEFTAATQSYYQQGQAVQGEWQGQLAESFGLKGAVTEAAFAQLAEGRHPETGEQLVHHRFVSEQANADSTTTKTVEHRAGWDATFSAPKSVSLTALVGGDERVRVAHREAVTVALTELERFTQARIGGNHAAETTGKFVAAKFEHDTARPVDGYSAPQLHTHAVIFNVTEQADGSTRALQPNSYFQSQQFATAVYQAELTYRLRALGYEIEAGRSGAPEIKGYSQEYLDASSPRSRQIRDHLDKHGVSGAEAAEIAAHTTRDSKQTLTKEETLEAHKQLAAQYGDQASRVIAEAQSRVQNEVQTIDPQGLYRQARARQAVTYARDVNFEREAVVDERQLMRDALRRGMGETTYADIRTEFEQRRGEGEFLQTGRAKHDSSRMFTTPAMIAIERENVALMRAGQDAVEQMLSEYQAAVQAQSRTFFNGSQRAVVEEVLTSRDRVYGLQGLAGTGKTSTLEAIREGAQLGGYVVEGFAPTGRAAQQLRDAGISADTLQGFLARGSRKQEEDAASRHLYLLDESSLASTRQVNAFLKKIGPEDRVLVVGDTRQHQSVDAGRAFEQLQEAGLRTAKLDTIVRQKDPGLLAAVQHLASGQTKEGVQLLADQGRITEIVAAKERIQAIAKDYAASPDKTLIVSPDNASRRAINEAVRVELQTAGKVSRDSYLLTTLVPRSELTGTDRAWAARYQVGDVIEYSRGSAVEGIKRGSQATVVAVNARENILTVSQADGQSVTYDPTRLRGVSVYREAAIEIARGDRIQFTRANKELRVSNRDLATVERVDANQITVTMGDKEKGPQRTVSFDPNQDRHFDHGYAVTSHSAQGLTVERVLVNIDTDGPRSLINQRLAYVSISRASDDARIYTNDAASLGERLATDVSKTAAVDFQQRSEAAAETQRSRQTQKRPASQQPESEQQKAFQYLGTADGQTGIALLKDRVRVHREPAARLAAIAHDYAAYPDRTVAIVADPSERREANRLIREQLTQQGMLEDGRSLSVLVEKTMRRETAADYQPGDLIHYSTPNLKHGIARDSFATVIAVDEARNRITVQKTDGEISTYNPAKLASTRSKIYTEEMREVASGERIRFTRADQDLGLRHGDLATVEKVYGNESLSVRLDNRKTVSIDATQSRHIEYGYAVDGAKTVRADRVLANIDRPAQLEHTSPIHKSLSLATGDVALYTRAQRLLYQPHTGEQLLAYAEAIAKTQSAPPLAILPAQQQQTAALTQAEAATIARNVEQQRLQTEKTQPMKSSQLRQFEQYHEAVQAERYRVTSIRMLPDGQKRAFILDKQGGVTKGFTPAEIAGRAAAMQRLGRRGENLYYTPLSEKKHHILIDDMDRKKLARLIGDGYKPAAILESSPGNYQAILTIPKLGSAFDREVGNRLAERLNREYGDPKLSGVIHPHRAPGYENRKPKHERADGTYPEVRLLKAERREDAKTLELSRAIERDYAQRAEKQVREAAQRPAMASPWSGQDISHVYDVHRADILTRQKGEIDYSRLDSMIALRMRATAHDRSAIQSAISTGAPCSRPDDARTIHQWDDYARRTADSAYTPHAEKQLEALAPKYAKQWAQLEGSALRSELQRPSPSALLQQPQLKPAHSVATTDNEAAPLPSEPPRVSHRHGIRH